jgi:hypothetical protein
MKGVVPFIVLLLIVSSGYAQTKFRGTWYVYDADSLKGPCLHVGKNTTSFAVQFNLGLDCKNKYHGDTLLLYVMQRDCGRLFQPGSGAKPPRINSLFAKCYINKSILHIIYTQKFFRDRIQKLGLITTMYR